MNNIEKTVKTSVKALVKPENKLSLIPNWLSFSRAIGGVAIPLMIYKKSPYKLLIGTVSFIALSDFLDGFTARKLVKKETKEGAMLDAISDKIFSLSLIFGMIPKNPTFALNGLLESSISMINASVLDEGEIPKSNMLGKIKIWPLSIALILSYSSLALQNSPLNEYSSALMNIGTTFSLLTIPLEIINVKEYLNKAKEVKKLEK